MSPVLSTGDLTSEEFGEICEIVYRACGIFLKEGKQDLVRARLGKRIRTLGLSGFSHYLKHLKEDSGGEELAELIDAISTNKTQFFRDSDHFEYLRKVLSKSGGSRLRFWSAGCSYGQEPYSLAMLLNEVYRGSRPDLKILATDISRPALNKAMLGIYSAVEVDGIPPDYLSRYFSKRREAGLAVYDARDPLRGLIRFARLNLMGEWPMKGPFDAILCRNVMIYFDRPTREDLIERFERLLKPGGHFLVGFSESLMGLRHKFTYVQPAVYLKDA